MNTERWRFYAEMVGIAAVVASLMALVLELRQTQSALMAATYQARAFDAIDLNLALQDSEHVLPLLATTDVLDPDAIAALSDVERLRLNVFFTGRRVDAENEYYQYRHGFLDEEHYEYGIRPFVSRNAPRWRALGIQERRPSFKAFVDDVLAESDE